MADQSGPFFPKWAGFTYDVPTAQPVAPEPQPAWAPEPVVADHPEHLVVHLNSSEAEQVVSRKAMVCHYCGELIHLDDPCVELFIGICSPSPKSGRLMVMEDPREVMNPTVNLHYECVSGYGVDNLDVSEHHYEPVLCERCEEYIERD